MSVSWEEKKFSSEEYFLWENPKSGHINLRPKSVTSSLLVWFVSSKFKKLEPQTYTGTYLDTQLLESC
jgi:hypothetical protein